MNLNDFLRAALAPVPDQRPGQWFANFTHNHRPALATAMIRHDVDPFYDDAKIWAAIQFVKEHWVEEDNKEKNPQNLV
jgi:hypothetical protein